MRFAVQIRNLSKTYVQGFIKKKKKKALEKIDLDVPEKTIYGILGPNGAGKTTLLSIIAGILLPDKGSVKIFGVDVHNSVRAKEVYEKINISSGHANFLWSMTVKENLSYYAMLYGMSKKEREHRIEELMELFSITSYKDVKFEELSTGTKQRLSLAKAFLNNPYLVLLDEPTVGLDPDVAIGIREVIKHFHKKKNITFIITTHNMDEAEMLCDEVMFIFGGNIKAKGDPKSLKKEMKLGDKIHIEFQDTDTAPPTALHINGLIDMSIYHDHISVVVDDHSLRLAELITELTKHGLKIKRIEIEEADLEDVFINFAR